MKRLVFSMLFVFGLTCCFCAQSKNQFKREVRVGEKLVELVKAKNYDKVFGLLDKIKVKDGCKIKIEPYDREKAFMAGGAVSSICIYDKEGKLLTDNFKDDFWSYLQVEKSKMGAWLVLIEVLLVKSFLSTNSKSTFNLPACTLLFWLVTASVKNAKVAPTHKPMQQTIIETLMTIVCFLFLVFLKISMIFSLSHLACKQI